MRDTYCMQGDLLSEMLERNAGKGVKALGPAKEQGAFKVHTLLYLHECAVQ